MPQKKVTRVEFPTKPLLLSQSTLLKRVAAYARVSTMKDAQENSLQSQQKYFTEYIRQHPDWVFAGMYTDDGVSGLSMYAFIAFLFRPTVSTKYPLAQKCLFPYLYFRLACRSNIIRLLFPFR